MRVQVLRDRNMRVLFAGQMTNMLGNTAMIVVLGIWVKDLTGSNSAAGLIFLLTAVASLFAPLCGMLVDRFSRRWTLFITDIISGIMIAGLVLVHDRSQVWFIYTVTLLYGISAQIYRAARGGLLHSMVPTDLLGDANGLFSSLGQALRIIGPLAGAAVYTVFGGGVVALADTVTFFLSAGSYLLLRDVNDLQRTAPDVARTRGDFFRELASGIRHVLANPIIRRLVLASAVAFFGAGMIDVAIFALADDGLHRTPAIIGLIGAMQGVGSVVTGLVVGRMMSRWGEYATASAGFLLNCFGLGLASMATMPTVIAGAVLIGFGLPMILVAEITLVQHRTPGDMQGRAITASDAIIDIPFAVSIAVGAGIIGTVGFRPIYIGVAAGFALAGLWLLPYAYQTKPQAGGSGTSDVPVDVESGVQPGSVPAQLSAD